MTEIRRPDRLRPRSSLKPRRMTPQVVLLELGRIKIGDILMKTTDGRQLALRRTARPEPEQARIIDVIVLERKVEIVPGDLAVFATATGPFPHEVFERTFHACSVHLGRTVALPAFE